MTLARGTLHKTSAFPAIRPVTLSMANTQTKQEPDVLEADTPVIVGRLSSQDAGARSVLESNDTVIDTKASIVALNPEVWPFIDRIVRDGDEEKVKYCKEDVDTLLVFAGLYSGILAAFLVQSYPLLQSSPQDTMIYLLGRIASQNYTVSSSSVNSTSPTIPQPSFSPPSWAIRVNVLWFASLIFSLAAASFGILVKQWLREFLAMDYPSAVERLRARQFRHPGLDDWRVFEIAATLPLLLQVALGLFFIGLCYLTQAVHDSVANTTLPLVCGWAFFLLATTLAPLFFPRCPYKTTFLKLTLKSFRSLGYSCIILVFIFFHLILTSPPFIPIWYLISSLKSHLPSSKLRMNLRRSVSHVFSPVLRGSRAVSSWIEGYREAHLSFLPRPIIEEEHATQGSSDEIKLLGGGIIPIVLDKYKQQDAHTPEQTFQFVLDLLSPHSNQGNQYSSFHRFVAPDVRSVPKSDWIALSDVVAEALHNHITHSARPNLPFPQWARNAVILLLSPFAPTVSAKASSVVKRCFQGTELLPYVLDPILEPCHSNPEVALSVLIQLASYLGPGEALPELANARSAAKILNLSYLSLDAWTTLIRTVVDVLQSFINSSTSQQVISSSSPACVTDSLYILLSESEHPVPSEAQKLLRDHIHEIVEALHARNDSPETWILMIHRLFTYSAPSLDRISDLRFLREDSWRFLNDSIAQAVAEVDPAPDMPLPRWTKRALPLLFSRSDFDLTPQSKRVILRVTEHFVLLPTLDKDTQCDRGVRFWCARRIFKAYREPSGGLPSWINSHHHTWGWKVWCAAAKEVLDDQTVPNTDAPFSVRLEAALILLENCHLLPLPQDVQVTLKGFLSGEETVRTLVEHLGTQCTNATTLLSILRHSTSADVEPETFSAASFASPFHVDILPPCLQRIFLHSFTTILLQYCDGTLDSSPSTEYPSWVGDIVVVLLSAPTPPLEDDDDSQNLNLSRTLLKCLEKMPALGNTLSLRLFHWQDPRALPDSLAIVIRHPELGQSVLRATMELYSRSLQSSLDRPQKPLIPALREVCTMEEHNVVEGLCWQLWSLLCGAFRERYLRNMAELFDDFDTWAPVALSLLLLASSSESNLIEDMPHNTTDAARITEEAVGFFEMILATSDLLCPVVFIFATIHPQDGAHDDENIVTFRKAFSMSHVNSCRRLLTQVCDHLRTILASHSGANDAPGSRDPQEASVTSQLAFPPQIDFVRLCSVMIELFAARHTSQSRDELSETWTQLWDLLAIGIRVYHDHRGWDETFMRKKWHGEDDQCKTADDIWRADCQLATNCLSKVQSLERVDADMFPALMYEALHSFASGPRPESSADLATARDSSILFEHDDGRVDRPGLLSSPV